MNIIVIIVKIRITHQNKEELVPDFPLLNDQLAWEVRFRVKL